MTKADIEAKLIETIQRVEALKAELYRADGVVVFLRELLQKSEEPDGQ